MLNIKKITKNLKNQRGAVSVLYAVIISGIAISILLSVSGLITYQSRMMEGIGRSVVAIFAADSCIEFVLKDRENPESTEIILSGSGEIDEVKCSVVFFANGVNGCTANNYCIKSVGEYLGVKRAIEIGY